jgi:putative transposase
LKVLREENPNYKAIILILDNFKTHLSRMVREEARRLGIRLLYLPPYSPDLNPIEFIWKSIKRIISLTFFKGLYELRELIKEWFLRLA